ncbi:MAG: SpoIIE family protein phosphatase [Planctomycetes bacterium]|nr:SpoIIE family protein phosphatase [Planctomycetota bacterium]
MSAGPGLAAPIFVVPGKGAVPEWLLKCLSGMPVHVTRDLGSALEQDAVVLLFPNGGMPEVPKRSGGSVLILVTTDGGLEKPEGVDVVIRADESRRCGNSEAVMRLACLLVEAGKERAVVLERVHALVTANREAAKLVADLEEKERRIEEQSRELEAKAQTLARANSEAGRLILQVEEKDRRISEQAEEILRYYNNLQKEMRLARTLQISLLPDVKPPMEEIRCHDRFIPATELCGDYYDYIILPDGSFMVVVADVTGHGVASALVSVQVRALTHIHALEGLPPTAILSRINRFIHDSFERKYLMTMFLVHVAPDYKATYCGAGHNPFMYSREGRDVELVTAQGIPLGIQSEYAYESDSMDFTPGMRMLLYTDGLVEVSDADQEQYGYDRLKEAFLKGYGQEGRALVDNLLREVEYFVEMPPPFPDDVTVVLLERVSS